MPLQRINLKQTPAKQTTLKHRFSRQCLPKHRFSKQRLSKQNLSKQCLALVLLCATPSLIQVMAAQTTSQSSGQTPRGIAPRNAATDYAAHAAPENLQIGASLLEKKDLQKIFVTNVDICCVVVEVAVYPQKDNSVKVSAADFSLRAAGSDLATRSSSAKDVAASLQLGSKEAYRAHGPIVTQTSDIGYGRPTGNDPNTPTDPNHSGIYQRQGVGVGVGLGKETSGSSASGAGNQQAMETELSQKELPELDSDKPIAGYLYFFIPKKNKRYELVYTLGEKKIVLALK
jgi:hypothetical protein